MSKVAVALAATGTVILAAIAALMLLRLGPAESTWPSQTPELARLDGLADDVAAMRTAVDQLASRVAAVEAKLTSQEKPHAPGGAAAPREAPDGGGAPSPESDAATAHDEAAPAAPPLAVAEALEGNAAERLREFVFDTIRQEREQRTEEQARRARERRREWEEMRKGPYGRYNLKVNSLGKKLDLNDYQRQALHGLLAGYSESFAELRKGVDWKDAEARSQYQESRKELQEQFGREFTQVLTREQTETFNSLPAWERSPEGGVSYSYSVGAENLAPAQKFEVHGDQGSAVIIMQSSEEGGSAQGGASGTKKK